MNQNRIDSLTILGSPWTIQYLQDDESEYYGCCEKDKRLISIWLSGNDLRDAGILLHEVMHAVWHEYEMDEETETEETTVNRISAGLMKVLTANPAFAQYINDATQVT